MRQCVGIAGGADLYHSADGGLLQHSDAGCAGEQSAGGTGGGLEFYGRLRNGAGGLCVAAGGPGAGLGMLRAGTVCAVGRRAAGLRSRACGVFFQRFSEILAAVCVCHVRRVRADPGQDAEVCCGRSSGGGDAAAGGGTQRRAAPVWRPVRDGAGRGPG